MAAETPARHPPLIQTFRALHNVNFRLFWFGTLVSVLGTWFQIVALTWLVLRLTNSPLALGAVVVVEFLPVLLFSLFGGALADRVDQRRVLLVTQTAMAIQALALAALAVTGYLSLWSVYALTAVLGIVQAIDTPTSQAFVEELVGPDKEALSNASSLTAMLTNGAKVFGPTLGGLIVAAIGEAGGFFLNAASFLGVIAALLLLRTDQLFPPKPPQPGSLWSQVMQGLTYVIRTPDIATIVLLVAALGTFGYNLSVLLPLVAKYVLNAGPQGLGLLSSALGAGALAASLVVASAREAHRRTVIVGAAGFSLALFSVALFDHWLPLLPLTMLLGVCSVLFLTTARARLQMLAPQDLAGRVMGVYTLLVLGSTPIGSALSSALTERIGIRATIAILAALCGVGVVAALLYVRRMSADLLPEEHIRSWTRLEPAGLRRHHLPPHFDW